MYSSSMHRKYPYKESTLCFCIPIIWIILLLTNSSLYRIRLFLPKHAVARTRRDRTLPLPVMHIVRKPFPDVSQMASVAAPQTHHHHSLVLRLAHGAERIHVRLATILVASRHARVDLLIPKVLRPVSSSPLSLLPRRRRNGLAARHDERNAFHRRVALRPLRRPPVRGEELGREVEVLLVLLRRRLKGDLGPLSLTSFLRSHVALVFRHSNNRADFAHSHQFLVALLAR